MKRTSEKTIYRDRRKNQLVEIIEKGDCRSLYFGGNVLQSTMSISVPHRLVLSYTRFMMATLLFFNPPRRALVIGVGAGSLIRFVHHHFPSCTIDGVDFSSHILRLARGYFNLPDSGGIKLHCGDGHDFLASSSIKPYDLILIDAFDHKGMAPSIYCSDFFEQCFDHLAEAGIVSLNMWSGSDAKMDRVKIDLKRYFGSCITLPVPERGNVICLAGKNKNMGAEMEQDYTELSRMSAEFSINFRQIFRVYIKQNLGYRQRIARFFS